MKPKLKNAKDLLSEKSTVLKFLQPRAADRWKRTCDVVIVQGKKHFYALAKSPEGGCNSERNTLNVSSRKIALQHIVDWANAHETRITSVQNGEEE